MADDIAARLKNMRLSQLKQLAKEAGVVVPGKMTATNIRNSVQSHIYEAIYEAESQMRARAAGVFGLVPSGSKESIDLQAGAKAESAVKTKLIAAIDKVAATSPAKAPRAKSGPSKPRTPKVPNPNVEAVRTLSSKAMSAKRQPAPAPSPAATLPAAQSAPAQPRPFFQPTPAPKTTVGQRAKNAYGKASAVLGPYAVAKQFIDTYNRDVNGDIGNMSRRDAVIDAAKTAAPGAALVAAPMIERGANATARGAFKVAEALVEHGGALNPALYPLTGTAAAVGVGAKAVAIGAKVASRAALPVIGAISAYQGAKEDDNVVRGAGRGVVRTLDPTSIFMDKGLGERMYDAAFGAASPRGQQVSSIGGGPVRLTDGQKAKFAQANAGYSGGKSAPAPAASAPGSDRPKGWSPEARIAAYQARNPMGQNAPYGGDPTKAPSYSAPVSKAKESR